MSTIVSVIGAWAWVLLVAVIAFVVFLRSERSRYRDQREACDRLRDRGRLTYRTVDCQCSRCDRERRLAGRTR